MSHRKLRNIRNCQQVCIYCGAKATTKDHVPSHGFIDNFTVEGAACVPSCLSCNNRFSKDEEYTFCALECLACNSTNIEELERESIKKIINLKPVLLAILKYDSLFSDDYLPIQIDWNRIANVLIKNSIGHLYYEYGIIIGHDDIIDLWHKPLQFMSEDEKRNFFTPICCDMINEVGSRDNQCHNIVGNQYITTWHIIDKRYYQYMVNLSPNLVRLVVRNYLAVEIRFRY